MPKKRTKQGKQQSVSSDVHQAFMRIASHQLRTPLSVVRWNLETLLEEKLGPLTVQQREFLLLTDDAATEVIRRLDDLLTAMEIDAGRITLHKESVRLGSLCAAVCQRARARAKRKQQQLVFRKPSSPLNVTADPAIVRDVVSKLIVDAIDYTPAQGKITVTLAKQGSHARLTVTDTGIGIPKDEQQRIFERFYRASNAATMKTDASGISLSIVKFFVEAHGGKIGFSSIEGEGSTFWVSLPIS